MGLREATAAVVVAVPFGVALTAAAADPEPVLSFADPAIVESSGLVARDGLLQTVNDSGDEARVFTVDADGRTVGVTRWDGEAVDVEAVAPGPPGRVWVGDIGDNAAARTDVSVTLVPVGRGDRSGSFPTYRLRHPDGPADAEALLAHPRTGRLYVVTKAVLGGELLAAPRRLDPDGANLLHPVGPTMGLVTDGAFLPDGRHVVLRDYTRAVVHTFPGLEPVAEVALPRQRQGEGLAVEERADGDDRLLVSSEGRDAPVYAVDLPSLAGGPAPADPGTEGTEPTSPDPTEPVGEAEPPRPDVRSWLIGSGVLVVMVVVLLRALRPR